jgi:hypothetical protein
MLKKAVFFFILMISFFSCKKDDTDYRLKYTGEFDFTIIEEFWRIGQDTLYDSSTFYGTIRRFSVGDEDINLDGNEFHYNTLDPDKRITITFLESKIITPEITNEGIFMLIQTHHYFHEGGFNDADKIEFAVTHLGGLGGGWNYYVSGTRK